MQTDYIIITPVDLVIEKDYLVLKVDNKREIKLSGNFTGFIELDFFFSLN
jgi:hypothetical protein